MKDPMNIDFDDPRWTAYVLGELGPEERRAIDLELETSEELKLFVEELQIAAFAMKDAVAQDQALGLTFQQRSVVRAAAEGKAHVLPRSEKVAKAWFREPFAWAAAGLAAAGLVAMIGASLWRSPAPLPVEIAQKDAPANQGIAGEKNDSSTPSAAPPAAELASDSQEKFGRRSQVGSAEKSITDSIAEQSASGLSGPSDVDAKREVLAKTDSADRRSRENLQAAEVGGVLNSDPLILAQGAGGGRDGALEQALRGGELSQFAPLQLAAPPIFRAMDAPGPAPGGGRGMGGGSGSGAGRADPIVTLPLNGRSVGALTVVPVSPSPAIPSPTASILPGPVSADAFRVDRNESDERLIGDNAFVFVANQQLATLSSDVDTASYSNVRRFINSGQLPPRAAVRIEELINYFSYDYPKGSGDQPITANIEASSAPWNPEHRLVRIGIKAKDVQIGDKPSNLVFLIDVSGSMEPAERLPLLKSGLSMLVERLTENDRVSIVTYAGSSGIALPPTNGTRKDVIRQAIDGLRAEGSTNGGEGIQTAYDLAAANFIRGGVNRVVLLTDGDFNVGVTDQNALVNLIEEKAKTGVFLSVLGVGAGNVKDAMMERLADRGNGNYAYIDSLNEARKVLVEQMGGTLITVAKDVKMQVEFNPAQVSAYRLIGYEDRVLAAGDFSNDRKDAGDIGAGHTVTALFEVVPVGVEVNNFPGAGPLRYQQEPSRTVPQVSAAVAREMLSLRIRYKDPEGSESKLIDFPLVDRGQTFERASLDFRFAAAVAEFGMLLRNSPYRGSSTWGSAIAIARENRGADREGYREEFIRLIERCEQIVRSAAAR